MRKINFFWLIALVVLFSACNETVKDEEVPVIDISAENAFPQNCATVYSGESFNVKVHFSDNVELGSYSIEMHHNFDQHTHSTSAIECKLDPIKIAKIPFLYLSQHSIPEGLKSYETNLEITIPAGVDTGDYHFMIRLTDKSGWQTFKGISVKVSDRNN